MDWREHDICLPNHRLITLRRLKKEIIVMHSLMMGKRECLNKINKLKNKITDELIDKFISIDIIEENHILIELIFKNKYVLPVSMIFPKEYPFRAPNVKVANNDYKKFLGQYQKTGLYKEKTPKCLCCSTICCAHNWGPKKDLFDIILEIYKILDLLYLPINDIMYKAILKKHIGYQID